MIKIISGLAGAVLVILLDYFLNNYWPLSKENSEVIKNYALVIGGFIGIYIAFKRSKAHDKQAETSERQIELLTKNQSTDIYSRAIEQLSSDNIYSRVGAIYSLSKLASDDKENYLEIVNNNLSSFIRSNGELEGKSPELSTPEDTSTAFKELCKLTENLKTAAFKQKADLSGAFMPGYNFSDIRLSGFLFNSSVFCKSHFGERTQFTTQLNDCSFNGATFYKIKNKSVFRNCGFVNARFTNCDLNKIELKGCNMEQAEFVKCSNIEKSMFKSCRNILSITFDGMPYVHFFEKDLDDLRAKK